MSEKQAVFHQMEMWYSVVPGLASIEVTEWATPATFSREAGDRGWGPGGSGGPRATG